MAIRLTLKQHFDANVEPVDSGREALDRLAADDYALVLVNRVFDANGASGLAFIRELRARTNGAEIPVMLVSNFEDAQREAVEAGALPGFGKAALGQAPMLARLHIVLRPE
jgi:CheY-like chemotaxis protein